MYLPSVALALLILIASHGGYAYPGGAPTSICNTSPGVFLRPGASHGDPQSGNGGFLISTDLPVSTSNGGGYDYAAGKLYTVLINDTVNPNIGFRGFVVQAQSVPGENLIGIFLVNSAQFQQYLDCRDSLGDIAMATVTHNNGGRQNMTEQRILWRAPPEMDGIVEFRYSVVRRMPTYYSNLRASENRGEVLPQTSEPTSPPRITARPTEPGMFELRTPSCTHGNGDCDRSVRFFRSSETQYTFDLEGGVGGGHATGWVAVGFSQTQDMYSTDVFACGTADGTTVEVLDTWNVAGSRQNLRDDTQSDIQMEEARIVNNRITCRFTRTIDGENPGRDIRLQDVLFVMVGTSLNQLSSNPPQLRTHISGGVPNPLVSPSPINISTSSIGATTSRIGGTTSSIGDTTSRIGDTTSRIGGTTSSIGDTTSRIGDTTSSIGDTTSRVGDTTSHIGDTTSSIGDTTSSIGDTTSSIGDTTSNIGDTTSSKGDTTSSIGDTTSNIGDTTSNIGDTTSSKGDTTSSIGGTTSSIGDTTSSKGDTTSSIGDTTSHIGDTSPNPFFESSSIFVQALGIMTYYITGFCIVIIV